MGDEERQRLDGRTVVVAGATGGVGEGVVRALLSRGAAVVALGRDAGRLRDLADRLGADHPGALTLLPCSVTDRDSAAVTEQVRRAAGGPVAGVVISIGVSPSPGGPTLLDLADDEVRSAVEDNEIGGWRALRALVPVVEATGAVVNLMGASAEIPFPRNPLMGSTNAALRSLVSTLSVQLEGTGPRVYGLVIGMVRTRARQSAGVDSPLWLTGDDVGEHAADLVLGDVPRPGQALRYLLDPSSGPGLVSPLTGGVGDTAADAGSPEDVVRAFYAAYSDGRPEDFDRVVSPDYTDYGHQPPGRGPGGARADYDHALAQAGGVTRYDLDAVVASGPAVAVAWTAHLPGGGGAGGLSLYQVVDGLITETRHTRLGAAPAG